MKTILTFCFIVLLLQAQAQKQAQFNGWEFLEWKTDSARVNKTLHKKHLEIDPFYKRFEYQGMHTRLLYQGALLQKVEQRKTFSVNRLYESRTTYERIRERLIKNYGHPHSEQDDTVKEVIHLQWDLKYTRIDMEYDYGYKVVDELGAGSYWIELVFEGK